MAQNEYLLKTVSLLSTSDVRYEGRLYLVDTEACQIALQHVRCWGTEDRRHGDEVIAPADYTYDFIIFKVENIKTLYSSDDRKNLTREVLDPLKRTKKEIDGQSGKAEPASGSIDRGGRYDHGRKPTRDRGHEIDRSFFGKQHQPAEYTVRKRRVGEVDGRDSRRYDRKMPRDSLQPRYYHDPYRRDRPGGYGSGPYRKPFHRQYGHGDNQYRQRRPRHHQGHELHGRRRAMPGSGAFLVEQPLSGHDHDIETPLEAFDFGTADLDTVAETKIVAAQPLDATDTKPAYDKDKDFFDNLTLDSKVIMSRPSREKVRMADIDTFGSASIYRPRRRRGYHHGPFRSQQNHRPPRPKKTAVWKPRQ